MAILIVGGLGYIGSQMWKVIERAGHEVAVIDDLSTGNALASRGREYYQCNLLDEASLSEFFKKTPLKFDVVMHFAAKSLVGESVSNPALYYKNNIAGFLNLLACMNNYGVDKLIYSSTAATFGEPKYSPIDENHTQVPINPYGRSKLMVESMLKDYAEAYGVNSVSLRYFNACGADPENEIGEMHDPETHLIPLILQAASGRRESISIFGRDYDTPDGTCIRDYVHVNDLCQAHELAAKKLLSGELQGANAFNLGNGGGFSVKEVIDVAKKVVAEDGRSIAVVDEPRRNGDPARLVADGTLAKGELGWSPQFASLETIIRHAWAWEKKMAGL